VKPKKVVPKWAVIFFIQILLVEQHKNIGFLKRNFEKLPVAISTTIFLPKTC
jgi:hypothetical protein